ncbi:MAG: glycosyltransferase family 2 protein [Proteobacteria bacterium]|nr:glycosyltransferase family 2 protein [Pseudomonadota bacterium]MCP4917262.1 glycosyltransferase family 2 protein [Pseudomonadota bacterium]
MFALIPARNEGPRVAAVVTGALQHVGGVVVVVNGCLDDTADQARSAGATVIESEPGYAAALKAGYRHLRGRAVVQLDADGQHPPSAIPSLQGRLVSADLVIGSRFAGPRPGYAVGIQRTVAIHGVSALTSALIGQRIHDATSGMHALSPRAVAVFAEHYPDRIADTSVLVRARKLGLLVDEVHVEMNARSGGDSMHGGPRAALYLLRVVAGTLREAARPTHPSARSAE